MTYGEDIDALGANHRWSFNTDSNDQIGSANGTDTSILYTGTAICKNAVNCAETNGISDRISLPTTTDINNSAQTRKAVCGWFMVTAIQNPPKNIYGEGNETQAFRFILGWGNNVIFEVSCPSFTLQIFADTFLEPNRAYHLCMIFEGSGYANELKAYLDGVKQLKAEPVNRQPDAVTLPARSVGEFADPAGTVAVGGTAVVLIASINGKYNQWATWDGASAVMSDSTIRKILFERGALADIIISTNTEANMQLALDTYSGTTRSNAPVCIDIEPVTGGGDFTLNLNNITFNEYASVHIRYTGSADTLTVININGSDCSISASPWGGLVVIKTRVSLNVLVQDIKTLNNIENARAYIEADTGGDLSGGTQIMNELTNASGFATVEFDYTSDQPIIGRVRKGTSGDLYKTSSIVGPITSSGLSKIILLIPDE